MDRIDSDGAGTYDVQPVFTKIGMAITDTTGDDDRSRGGSGNSGDASCPDIEAGIIVGTPAGYRGRIIRFFRISGGGGIAGDTGLFLFWPRASGIYRSGGQDRHIFSDDIFRGDIRIYGYVADFDIDRADRFHINRFSADTIMTCPRCKTKMKEMKRSFHKKRKWVCPTCGRVRFQQAKDKSK